MKQELQILAKVKKLAIEYYNLTGKPLGVTGEVAEYEAAEKLGLELAEARTEGFDATRLVNGNTERIQIKGRKISSKSPYKGRVPKIDIKSQFDYVILVLLNEEFETFEIWEAPREAVIKRLIEPGSKARNERGSLEISQFKSIAKKIWEQS